nr:class I SAM-dependent methyltransferase [uncultured Carboxylicivirga sp.]
MKEMWDDKFSKTEYAYGVDPNIEFKEFIDQLEPGKILLLGEGEGRNAVYTASKGWNVTAVDFSSEGQKKAYSLAKKHHVDIEYKVQDVTQYKAPDNSYDCIALIFLHMPSTDFYPMLRKLHSTLTNNGKLFIVGFHTDQLNYSSGGPKKEDWLLTNELLEKELTNYSITKNTHLLTHLSQGYSHQGQGSIVIFNASK